MKNVLYRVEKGKRLAVVYEGLALCKGKIVVDFYYGNYPDFEWKRGAHGISCDVCDTFEQAKRKANYYVSKNW